MNAANPGLLKVLGGFVFPVGLAMCVVFSLDVSCLRAIGRAFFSHVGLERNGWADRVSHHRIVLGGYELLTSNMMVSGAIEGA